jgi:2-polyprenyl-6-methoxyphenol hydroxylase-like FAD-dependent oxidoreductase
MMSYAVPAPTVLIVGAGPTGLTLAHELLLRGVKTRVIEKARFASSNTKALGVMARTLELLAHSGVTKQMVAQGVQVPTFSIWSSGRQVAHLDFARGTDSPYPYILMLPQHEIEVILTDEIVRQGGSVERGVELVGLTQRPARRSQAAGGVEIVLRHADGTEERTSSSFLIGCDGAHSTVRHLLNVPFVGSTMAQQFLTGDVRMRWKLPHGQALAYMNHGHLIAYFPLPDGQHRILSAYPAGKSPSGEVTCDEIQRMIDICGPPGARATDPSWLGRCQVDRRMVETFVHEQVLLAGDAAHVHSPLGAQGMNMGMQDATNLAWKLALVVQGRAPARLLESYHVERFEVSKRLLQQDALLTRLAFLHHPLVTVTRDRVARVVSRYPQLERFVAWTVAGLRISYRHGPLRLDYRGEKRKLAASGAKVGSRAPNGLLVASYQGTSSQLYDLLTGTGHALLLFASRRSEERVREVQSVLASWQDLVEVYPIERSDPDGEGAPTRRAWHDPNGALARRYGIAYEGLVLIRPDGYISFRSRPIAVEPLQRYLRAHFSPQDALCEGERCHRVT